MEESIHLAVSGLKDSAGKERESLGLELSEIDLHISSYLEQICRDVLNIDQLERLESRKPS